MNGQVHRDRVAMVANMTPILQPGEWVFVSIPGGGTALEGLEPLAIFREAEGVSLLIESRTACAAGHVEAGVYRQITLSVYSALDGVGLTAAVAGALADAGIACNMIAAFHHDHVFVPAEDAERALEVLRRLQAGAQA